MALVVTLALVVVLGVLTRLADNFGPVEEYRLTADEDMPNIAAPLDGEAPTQEGSAAPTAELPTPTQELEAA